MSAHHLHKPNFPGIFDTGVSPIHSSCQIENTLTFTRLINDSNKKNCFLSGVEWLLSSKKYLINKHSSYSPYKFVSRKEKFIFFRIILYFYHFVLQSPGEKQEQVILSSRYWPWTKWRLPTKISSSFCLHNGHKRSCNLISSFRLDDTETIF